MLEDDKGSDSNREVGAGAAWLGWKNLDNAIVAFLDATNNACEILEDLSIADTVVEWLHDAEREVEGYHNQLDNCEDDLSGAVDLVAELEDEAQPFSETLSFLDEVEDEIDEQLGELAPKKVRKSVTEFVLAKLLPVREAGWHLYYVMLQAE